MENREKERPRFWWAKRILAMVLVVVLTAAVGIGMGIWNEYRDAVMDTQKQQLLLTVQSLGDSMEVVFQDYLEDLEGLYRMAGQEGLWEAEAGQSPDGPESALHRPSWQPNAGKMMRHLLAK